MKPSKELEKLAEDFMRITLEAIDEHSTTGEVNIALSKEYKTINTALDKKSKEEGITSMELQDLLMCAIERVAKGKQ